MVIERLDFDLRNNHLHVDGRATKVVEILPFVGTIVLSMVQRAIESLSGQTSVLRRRAGGCSVTAAEASSPPFEGPDGVAPRP